MLGGALAAYTGTLSTQNMSVPTSQEVTGCREATVTGRGGVFLHRGVGRGTLTERWGHPGRALWEWEAERMGLGFSAQEAAWRTQPGTASQQEEGPSRDGIKIPEDWPNA